jgi:hypothetical protein
MKVGRTQSAVRASIRPALLIAVASALAGCGGGGDSGGTPTPDASSKTELEGTWIYASAGHTTEGSCGLDLYGARETRVTYTFDGSTLRAKQETCVILIGNTGSFVQTNTGTSTFALGGPYMTVGADTYKAIDVTTGARTQYSGYALSGNVFKQAGATVGNDGNTVAARMRGTGFQGAGIFVKQ